MGLKRMIWRFTRIGRTVDTIKNILDEGSVKDGVKRTIKEDICEDNPVTSYIYKTGKYDGNIEGYVEASDEYEKKLLSQADEFLKQKQIMEADRNAYEALLDEYEMEIKRLNSTLNQTEEEKNYLVELMTKKKELQRLK